MIFSTNCKIQANDLKGGKKEPPHLGVVKLLN